MVSDVQGVNDFSDVLPYYLRSPAWVENYVIKHSIFCGIRTCVPGRGSGCFATFRLSK